MVIKNKTSLASSLRHRVTIEEPVETSDGAGGFTVVWNKFADAWAQILPKNGSEKFADEHLSAPKKITVTIRYMDGVTGEMRVRYGERVFSIISILNPYEENILLEITAQEN